MSVTNNRYSHSSAQTIDASVSHPSEQNDAASTTRADQAVNTSEGPFPSHSYKIVFLVDPD